MRSKQVFYTLAFALFASILFGCGTGVKGGEMALQYKPFHGGVQQKVFEDGFKWHLPWNGLILYDVRWQKQQENIRVLTSDNLHLEVDISLRIRPKLSELYELNQEIGPDYYKKIVQPVFLTAVQKTLSGYAHDTVPEKLSEIQEQIDSMLHQQIDDKHLDITNLVIEDVQFPPEVNKAVEAKLTKKQEMEQKEYELEIARKEAEIKATQATGFAQSQQVVETSLTPQYLQFLSLEVQRELARSPNKTFIFVPVGPNGLPFLLDPEKDLKKQLVIQGAKE